MSFRTRLLTTVAAAVVVLAAAVVWWTSGPLRDDLRRSLTTEMEREARLVSALVGERSFTDSLADRLGRTVGHRVTLIGPDGRAEGDSDVPADRLPAVESYADRPEVRAALRGEIGTAERTSATVARAFLYVAVPHGERVVRLASSPGPVDQIVGRYRRLTLAAAGAVLLALLLAGRPLERFAVAPFRTVRRTLTEVAAGDFGLRLRPDGDDEPARLAAAGDRVAGRLEQLAAGMEERREMEEIFEEMEEGVAVVEPGGRIVRANRSFLDLLGREEAVGERFGTLFRDPAPRALVEQGLEGNAASREVELGDRYVLLSIRPHGEKAVVTSRDLTRVRRLEGVRRDFVANVSHELKTPLTSVLGFAEALAESEVSPERARDFGQKILENGARMRRMIDELMDLSRVESGEWEPEPEDVPVAAAARASWQAVLGGRDDGPELALDVEPGLTVRADPDALRSVLRNLLSNAVRYSPAGGTVGVSAETKDGSVRVEVTDRGPGIPTVHRERVFERFYRVDAGRSRDEGGTGLGLAIVKHLVEAHRGEVGVEGEVGRGSTFWFTLPRGRPEADRTGM